VNSSPPSQATKQCITLRKTTKVKGQ